MNPLGANVEPEYSVSIVTDNKLDYQGSIPSRGWEFFSSPLCPDRLWGHPSLLSNGYQGALSSGVKWLGREADHSPPPSTEVNNAWHYTSTPSIHLHGVVLS
jgi:hypothetical protein